eukprot:766899-Hanusia_phi.AAC.3
MKPEQVVNVVGAPVFPWFVMLLAFIAFSIQVYFPSLPPWAHQQAARLSKEVSALRGGGEISPACGDCKSGQPCWPHILVAEMNAGTNDEKEGEATRDSKLGVNMKSCHIIGIDVELSDVYICKYVI